MVRIFADCVSLRGVFVNMHFSSSLILLGGLLASSVSAAASYSQGGRKKCTVSPRGHSKDDVPNIMKAFKECGNGGIVEFTKGNFTIAQRLNPVLNNCEIQWHGTWTVC